MKRILIVIFLLISLLGVFFLGRLIYSVYLFGKPEPSNNPSPSPSFPPSPTPTPTTSVTASPAPQESPKVNPVEISWANRTKKQVVFTFDAGADANSLPAILTALSKHNLKGTFFLTGKWAEQNPELTKQISEAGHEIFNHTYDHPYLTQISDEQIISEFQKADEIISDITEISTKPYFRPPYGDRNQHVLNIAAGAGYQSVYWTIDAKDWRETEGVTAQQVKEQILNNLAPGTIYIMHVGDNLTGQVLDDVLAQIENQGYKIIPLSEGVK